MKPILYDTSGDKVRNVSLIKKRALMAIVIIWFFVVTYLGMFFIGYNNCKEKMTKEMDKHMDEVYYTIFGKEEEIKNPYAPIPFLFNDNSISDEQATYIIKLAEALDIDPDFCIALLNKENPDLNEIAISKENQNGSVDIGMWQLNQKNFNDTKYSFDKLYWPFNIEFDPYNWKHNTWIALHHIQDLYKEFGDYKKVAQAYNGGASKVRKGTVVMMAKKYSETVMQTYNNLKNYS